MTQVTDQTPRSRNRCRGHCVYCRSKITGCRRVRRCPCGGRVAYR